MPIEQYQRQGDFFEQRKEFRQQALVALRKREGLPQPVDETGAPLETRFDDEGKSHYHDASGKMVDKVLWMGTGKDGKPGGFATGQRKGDVRGSADTGWVDLSALAAARTEAETTLAAEGIAPFEILEVSEDGRKLTDEIRDLERDAKAMGISERVSHGAASEQAPDFELSGTSDEEIDAALQEYIKRGRK